MFEQLQQKLSGEVYTDSLHQKLYATDASAYRILPQAVVVPKHLEDIKAVIAFANEKKLSITARAAGTSLAGQVVNNGIILNTAHYFKEIISINTTEKTCWVEPGVIRDELNAALKQFGVFFGPNTSTSNRCCIGGMLGNNSSGTTSIKYGVTRDKVLAVEMLLSDASTVLFEAIDEPAFYEKLQLKSLEGEIYRCINHLFSNETNRISIQEHFPHPEIHRRNTGYALDELLKFKAFGGSESHINLSKIICGSEGTLGIATKIKLQLDDLPPKYSAMLVPHFESIEACLKAVYPVMQHDLFACEMMDKTILDCTKDNRQQTENRQFIVEDPAALLMLQLNADSEENLKNDLDQLQATLKKQTKAYAQPVLYAEEIDKALELRKAGLGLLGNIKGDKKAVPCIEDTAVRVADLADYIAEFTDIMKGFGQNAVYYAHAGAGELHLRPLLNLKDTTDQQLFQQITSAVADLVKKYRGSLSGEHGDGIVRGGFVQKMIGEQNYKQLKLLKTSFDPEGIFNPGKIVDALPMLENLRFKDYDKNKAAFKTGFSFKEDLGLLNHVEKCNGSGDCLKSGIGAAMMCPSYHVSRKETDTTRGRANVFRELLSTSDADTAFKSNDLEQVMDLCIGCKACKTECPSSVDMALLKSEYLFQKNQRTKVSSKARQFGFIHQQLKKTTAFAPVINWVNKSPLNKLIKHQAGIHHKRSLPDLNTKNLIDYLNKKSQQPRQNKTLYLFLDEFTQYLDYAVGKACIDVLVGLGYSVNYLPHAASGRALISKGFLNEAKALAEKNVALFYPIVNEQHLLIGIEPSALLSFADEYPRLCKDSDKAKYVAQYCRSIDRFIYEEFIAGNISEKDFSTQKKEIRLHVHCHQKSLEDSAYPLKALSIPQNYCVELIPSGCCGMAGSFGMEKEHYDFSIKIAEQRLFPFLRKLPDSIEIAATGHSCRHQIKDGINKATKHPIEYLSEALLN